jgi:predicted Ser/Thr protein kinase
MDRIGRYKIVRELGRGAMGVVYHAIDPNIGRPVAIKTIRLTDVATGDEQKRLRERLFREARSAGMLSHPGIVTIYDVEEQDGLAYIAMEYVDGPTLDQVLSGPEAIPPEGMFSILAQTAAALDYAHGKGIVHRDITPANIMITNDGTAKIADFGIAKITTSEQFTMTGSIVGTPHYMSPEQVQGQTIDGRSDQFSMAVMSYEMLTGEKPYTGEHLTTVVYKIVAEEPIPPHRINPSLSGPIENVIRKGLAKKADGRYATCTEFADALEKACAGTKNWKPMPRGGSLNEPTMADAAPRAAITLPPARKPRRAEDATTTGERRAEKKSGFLPFLMAVLMAAVLLMLIGWQAMPWLRSKPQATVETAENKPDAAPPEKAPEKPAEKKPSPVEPPATPETKSADPVTKAVHEDSETAAPKSTPAPPKSTPAPPKATPAPPISRPAPSRASTPPVRGGGTQTVAVITSPGGATAMIDGKSDSACKTPCELDASPGKHIVAISMPGYQIERREVEVGRSGVEMPAIILRAQTGTLMISSTPIGATITINGKKNEKVTPAVIQLAAGNYKVTVEKDGRQSSGEVDLHNGETKSLRVVLDQ